MSPIFSSLINFLPMLFCHYARVSNAHFIQKWNRNFVAGMVKDESQFFLHALRFFFIKRNRSSLQRLRSFRFLLHSSKDFRICSL